MTFNEAYKELKRLEKCGTNIFEGSDILRTNLDLQYAWDYNEETSKKKSDLKAQGECADCNTKGTGFSVRSMSAYRSGHLKLVFNPFDVGEQEFFWLLNPWKDEFDCIRNAAVGILKLARRFELQDSILPLREYESPFSLSRDCFMEIMGVMNDVIEADDFIVGLARYGEINHLRTCYLLNGADNLKKQYELIGGSIDQLIQSMGAEFLTSTNGTTQQINHVFNTLRILAHSSSKLSLSKEELTKLCILAKSRPSDKEMAKKLAESARLSLDKDFLNGLRDVRTIKEPREAELTMRLAQSMAPELMENLIERILVLMNNLSYLKSLAEKAIMPEDAYLELIECYEMSESYTKDYIEYIQKPAAMYYHKDVKKLTEKEIDNYYAYSFSNYVARENDLYYECGEIRFVANEHWQQLLEILNNLPAKKNDFRMCLIYLSYQKRWVKRYLIDPVFGSAQNLQPQAAVKKDNKHNKEFREFIKDAWRTEIIIRKLHRLIGNKRDTEALKILTRALWIEWLSKKPTAYSIRKEFPTITGSDALISRCFKEKKPMKNGKVDEEVIEKIRQEYERA